jgi:hypothetical protein
MGNSSTPYLYLIRSESNFVTTSKFKTIAWACQLQMESQAKFLILRPHLNSVRMQTGQDIKRPFLAASDLSHDFAPVRRFILEVLMLTHFGQTQIH